MSPASPYQRTLTKAGIAFALLLGSSDILAVLGSRNKDWRWPSESALWVLASGLGATAVREYLLHRERFLQVIRRAAPAIVLVLLATLSVRWSIDRQTTLRSLQWLVTATSLGILLATVRPLLVLVDGIALFGVIATAVGSILSAIGGAYTSSGNWLGLFGNRNGFGALIGFVWPAVLCASRGSMQRRLVGGFGMLILTYALLRTGSKTSLVSAAAVSVVFGCLVYTSRCVRRGVERATALRRTLLPLFAISFGGLIAVWNFRPRWVVPDPTFSNRTYMWKQLLPLAQTEWLHGYGYGAFWSGARGYLLETQLRTGLGDTMVTAHNGFLHEWLGLGICGLVLTILTVSMLFYRGIRAVELGSRGQSSFILLAAVAILVQNLMEAMFTSPPSLAWILVVTTLGLPYRTNRRETRMP